MAPTQRQEDHSPYTLTQSDTLQPSAHAPIPVHLADAVAETPSLFLVIIGLAQSTDRKMSFGGESLQHELLPFLLPFSNSTEPKSPLINLNYPHLISNFTYINY